MNIGALMDQLASQRVLIVGDVMLDNYLIGEVNRISPEAPVPVVNLHKADSRLGGAANVALNVNALGAEAILCSVTGDDEGGDKIQELLLQGNLETKGIVKSSARKTSVKTRVIGNKQQLLRIDDETSKTLNEHEASTLFNKIQEFVAKGINAIILEDYNKGVLTPWLISKIVALANDNEIVISVDPKKDNFFEYKNVTLFKPNLKELKEGLDVSFNIRDDKSSFEAAVEKMEGMLNNKISFITLSEHGVFIKDSSAKYYIPAHIRNISDVSGAGDTVISVATLCLAIGLPIEQVARVANLSGGLVCEMNGVVPVDRNQLMTELDKIKF